MPVAYSRGRRSGATSTDDDKADGCIADNCYKDERGLTLAVCLIFFVSSIYLGGMTGNVYRDNPFSL